MIAIDIPGYGALQLHHLVMDFNGTLAVDGHMVDGVADRLTQLGNHLALHVITADTFGRVQQAASALPCKVHILPQQDQAEGKRDYVHNLGADGIVALGNGRNDRLMLMAAKLGIAVVLAEGAFGQTLSAADIVCTSIDSALDLLCKPLRLTATLRG